MLASKGEETGNQKPHGIRLTNPMGPWESAVAIWFAYLQNAAEDESGQIIATSHGSLTPKGSGLEGKSPYFAEIQVGEIL